jgi:ethanolamine-phosphate cytidylyltransferase
LPLPPLLPSPPLTRACFSSLPHHAVADGKVPKPTDRVVYLCGAFDLFNSGHVAALQAARKLGDFLLVGIHDDATVNALRGHGMPVLNLYERALSLLSCKYVDEVIIGAPWVITDELITSMNIAVVAKGEFGVGGKSGY